VRLMRRDEAQQKNVTARFGPAASTREKGLT